ncbi:hypothetical protein SKAU_G00215320 [Synaphobranchus kaupii]|uniref:SRCR domain-containing protein n=1 Tax=Synaphobranchus kaupii TaxID=118154 RepID=A0A9Q1F9U0_SYNKA|nr:hypothetical protein SKAU_G00215320 [Synaphobranchus kaupii]
MELLKVAIVLQALSLCEADAFIPQLSGNCSGTLGLFKHTVWTAVFLTPASAKRVANQICRHLGCTKAFSVSHSALHNTTCLTNCTYSHSKLKKCTEASQDSCTNVTKIVCMNKAVRLAGNSTRCEGRVELWNAGKWGTVCDDNWDLEDASVVCNQLSCGSAFRATGEGGVFGAGSGPIFLDKVNCTGTERDLWDCSGLRRSNCTHKEDAGVVCSGAWTTTFGTSDTPSWGPRYSPAEVGCIVLSLLLVMALVVNVILCCRFRKRERGVPVALEQSKQNLHAPTEQQENDYRRTDDAHMGLTGTTGNNVLLNQRRLCTQRSVDNFSIDSDYEAYDFSAEPAIALATFKNSLRNKGDNRSPTLKPSSLYCLTEEGTDQANGLADNEPLPGCREQTGGLQTLGENPNSGISETKTHAIPTGDALPVEMTERGEAFQPQKEKHNPELVDSFDSSSTSSGECYENTGKEAELQIQEMTGREHPIQPQNKHCNPGLTNYYLQPEPHPQGDAIPVETAQREGPNQPQTEDHDPGFTNCYLQPNPHNEGDSSSTSSGDEYDIPEGQEQPLCPAVMKDFDQSSSDNDYDDVANYIL